VIHFHGTTVVHAQQVGGGVCLCIFMEVDAASTRWSYSHVVCNVYRASYLSLCKTKIKIKNIKMHLSSQLGHSIHFNLCYVKSFADFCPPCLF
jgi:hypothetical protein